ncbi:MAG: hypothetical protein WCL32_13735 [Planctomycetota bacterium]
MSDRHYDLANDDPDSAYGKYWDLGCRDLAILLACTLCSDRANEADLHRFACLVAGEFLRDKLTDPELIDALAALTAFTAGEADRASLERTRRPVAALIKRLNREQAPTSRLFLAYAVESAISLRKWGKWAEGFVLSVETALVTVDLQVEPNVGNTAIRARRARWMAPKLIDIILKEFKFFSAAEWANAVKARYRFDDPRLKVTYVRIEDLFIRLTLEKQTPDAATKLQLDAFQKVQHRETVTQDDLQPFVESLKTPGAHRWAVFMLMPMAQFFEAAQKILLDLLDDPSGKVRFDAISNFSSRMKYPREFIVAFLRKALDDRSAKNRIFAAQGCEHFDCKELLPQIEDRAQTEKTEKVKVSMRSCAAMVRHGFSVSDGAKEDEVSISFPKADHWTCILVSRVQYSSMTFDEVKQLVIRCQNDKYGKLYPLEGVDDSIYPDAMAPVIG